MLIQKVIQNFTTLLRDFNTLLPSHNFHLFGRQVVDSFPDVLVIRNVSILFAQTLLMKAQHFYLENDTHEHTNWLSGKFPDILPGAPNNRRSSHVIFQHVSFFP